MICLRCGYCCIMYPVAIVKEDIGPESADIESNLEFKSTGKCRHLTGNKPGEYSCSMHDKSWFINTPCHTHEQFEWKNSNCRIGEQIIKNEKEKNRDGRVRTGVTL